MFQNIIWHFIITWLLGRMVDGDGKKTHAGHHWVTEGVHCDSKTSTRGPAFQGMKAAVSPDVAGRSLTDSMD